MSLTSELGKYRQGQKAGEQAAYQTCLQIVASVEAGCPLVLAPLDAVRIRIEAARKDPDQ